MRRRLQSDDWIKCPMLASFLQPMKAFSPLLNPPEVHQGILAQLRAMPPGATSLYGLESALRALDSESVCGIEHWFDELGNHEGYQLDKRLQSWSFEVVAMPRLASQRVVKLPKLPASKSPDYVVRVPGMTLVLEAKLIFGKTWPFKILQTMLDTLHRFAGWGDADSVFIHPTRKGVHTSVLEGEVASLSVETLLEATEKVATASTEIPLTPNLTMSPRTAIEGELGLRAFSARLPAALDERGALFASLRTPLATICRHAEDAWKQCAHYRDPTGSVQLDVAVIGSENLPVLMNGGRTEAALTEWLRSEVWPKHPLRALCLQFAGRLQPVWLLGPAVASQA